jgi:3-hydroxyisobutyrate dehydrogenase
MTDHLPRIALLGLGTMGAGMARNILAAGLPLAVWNRSHDKAAPFADLGATVAPNPGAAVAGADLVVTMLFDAESVIEVMTAAEPGFAPGQTWVQTSTVGVEGALSLQGLADRLGLRFVDAPVLGTKKPAEDGTLVVLAAGAEEDLAVCVPLFEAIGSRTVPVGEAVDASRLKLVANAWVLAVLEGVAESLTLARGMGLDPELFLEAIRGGAMDAPYVQLKGAGMIARDFTPAFTVDGAIKDASLILDAADVVGVRMDVTGTALRLLRAVAEAGHGDEDMSAIALGARRL